LVACHWRGSNGFPFVSAKSNTWLCHPSADIYSMTRLFRSIPFLKIFLFYPLPGSAPAAAAIAQQIGQQALPAAVAHIFIRPLVAVAAAHGLIPVFRRSTRKVPAFLFFHSVHPFL